MKHALIFSLFLLNLSCGEYDPSDYPPVPLEKDPCSRKIDTPSFLKSLENMDSYLEEVKLCLKDEHPEYKSKTIDKAASLIIAIDSGAFKDDPDSEKAYFEKGKTLLKTMADLEEPVSQHNYATLHNGQQGKRIFHLTGYQPQIFAKWTKRAASNYEPRSMFNLAVRLVNNKSEEDGFPKNLRVAYTLFLLLDLLIEKLYQKQLGHLKPIYEPMKKKIEEELSKWRIEEIKENFRQFDFKSLRDL